MQAHDPLVALVASFVAATEWQAGGPAERHAAALLDDKAWAALTDVRRLRECGVEEAAALYAMERVLAAER